MEKVEIMAEPQPAAERRRFARQVFALPMWVEWASRHASKASWVMSRTRDVSNKGLYFWSPVVLQLGQLLCLRLEVPPQPNRNYSLQILWEAEVIRIEAGKDGERGMGVAARILRFDVPLVHAYTDRVN